MPTITTRIDTGKVAGRRELHFNSVDDILADVDRLAGSREIRTLGNWSAGQIFEHVARVMDKSIDGSEFNLPADPPLRLQPDDEEEDDLQAHGGGHHTSQEGGGGADAGGDEPGRRARSHPRRHPSPADRPQTRPSAFLGALTKEEWTQLHCRHAELHFSFLIPE